MNSRTKSGRIRDQIQALPMHGFIPNNQAVRRCMDWPPTPIAHNKYKVTGP